MDLASASIPVAGEVSLAAELQDHINALLMSGQRGARRERRRGKRYAYPYPIPLTPIDAKTISPIGETILVMGKHLTDRGLDFYCSAPLPYRHVVAAFARGTGWLGLAVELRWCRFGQHGFYENGGRFLYRVDADWIAPPRGQLPGRLETLQDTDPQTAIRAAARDTSHLRN